MAQQIKKKYIEDNAVDGEKLLLLPTQTLRKLNSSGVEVDVIQQLVDADAALQIEIDAEEVARQLGDDALQGAITSEEAARIAGDAALQGEIDAEEAARAAADTALQNAIDAEAAARAAADTVVATAVQEVVEAEVEARIAADTALQGEIDAEEMARAAGDAALQGAIDAEAAARVAADSALQGAIDAEAAARVAADSALQGEIDAEETRALAAEAALQSAIDAEELAREQGDSALDARVSPIEKRYQVNKFTIYENNAQVYADAQPGVQDPSGQLRDGWYYTNASAGQKINWYYFDGINNATVTLGAMSAYAVMTFDGLGSMPLLAVYTKPTGSGDLMPGFARSRVVYSGSSTGLTIGKKYLVYFGENPTVHPELPRVQLVKSTSSSAGSQGASEEVLTVSFGSNSGASVGSVKFMTESLGIWSESYKHEVSLRIRQASQLSLNNEQAARAAADSALQSAIDAEAAARIAGDSAAQSSVAAEQAARELADSALQAAIAAEQARAETAESGLQSQIDTEKGRIDAILLASDADKDSFAEIVNLINSVDTENDSAFASYVLSNDAAVAQLQTDLSDEAIARAAADTALSEAIATEATNRAQEIAEEVAAREAADTALSADISDEVARALAAEEALDGKIDQEIMDRAAADTALQTALSALESFNIAQVMHVSKSGSDTTGTGGQHKPYLTISKALSMITDATPSKRYVVRVSAGAYTETSVALPSNVFVVGESKESVRITGPVSMGAWTQNNSGSDDRSGFSMVSLLSAASFDWSAAKSRAGKLYMNEVVFGSTVSLYGYDNAIAQAQFNACVVFGAMTISGVNVGAFTNNVCFSDVTLNQHPNGGMATILAATGGSVGGTLRLNTTVNDSNRRCSAFLKSFYSENLIVDGAASYADCDLVSQGKSSTQKLNGGNFVALSPRINHSIETEMVKPLANNAHNMGDWGRQWFFNFAYVHASAGTDMYVMSAMQNYDPAGDSEGRSIFILSDGYGLKPDVSGGDIQLETAAVSGTGVRGKIKLDGKEIDVSSKQIKSLAAGTAATDAVNVSQLESGIAAEQARAEAAESGLQSQIDTEKGRIDAILLASDADKDSFAEIVTLINSVDTENDTAFAGYVLSNDAAVQALEDAVADLESAVASVVQFHKESFTVDATMISDGYVDVTHLAKPNSMVLFVGRLAMLEGHDYSLSAVGGVTRVTFLAPMLTPSEEALAVGDKLFFTYAK